MRVSSRALVLAALALVTLGGRLAAQPPRVLLGDLSCVPKGGHALAQAIAAPLPAGSQVRIYFRRQGYGDFYWVPARPTSDGRFWGVLPLPEPDNSQAELYASVVSASGMPLAQSQVRSVPVQSDCRSQLDNAQAADATHLIVGETSLGQKDRKVAWWQCEGIRERIDVRGERRNDDVCVPVPLWWERPEVLAPLAVVGAGGITTVIVGGEPPTPVSPSHP
jgi:hypothetical protein